jgi:hypothetical protein
VIVDHGDRDPWVRDDADGERRGARDPWVRRRRADRESVESLPEAGSPTDVRSPLGALVVNTPPRLHRTELEIHSVGAPWSGPHTAVRECQAGAEIRYAGVFRRLDAGDYELRVLGAGSGVVVPIVIRPGAVVETWLDAPID